MERPDCPHCGSSWVNKAREVKNKYVTKQGYKCPECGRFFVERDGFEGKTYPKEVIVEALHLYVEGLSLSKIRIHLKQHRGYSPSDGSILNWVREYSELVERFEHEQMEDPEIGKKIHLDEVVLKVGKKRTTR
ncbi:hypothetical protein AKJ65_07915 [candidate division MSBL1 archaeon SCGC-AAA259E19]|uniref:Transposase n=1 Tax=candidate division MSBL1 archaeon SCGC-AAA259E19 TaxID=1698264 RepID=A0A133UDC7_9EURY|nr:hypothetical protein AKJ65_07915 [candidate division MSBL1 archaeon SCGC-AAA259E19]